MTTLAASAVTRRYGGLVAVDRVDLAVSSGRITALIGPNGAGKTTLFACLTGVERATSGHVLLDGRDVTRLSSDRLANLGVARTFQRLSVFPSMTVAGNLRVGAENRRRLPLLRGLLGFSGEQQSDGAVVADVLRRLGLEELGDERAASLPTGTLRLVELGRALCRQPRLLLLDEPASGLDTAEVRRLQAVLTGLAADGVGVLVVEHDLDLVFAVADEVGVMAGGRVVLTGPPEVVRADPRTLAAFAGAGR